MARHDQLRPWIRILTAVLLLGLYAFSQPWSERGYVSDVEATSIPAWHFVETGSWDLTDYRGYNDRFVATETGVISNRSPGIIGLAILAYGATKPLTDGFENWPGTALAVFSSWLAVLFVAASAERLRRGLWLVAIVLFGLGTATWGASANQLGPHGPAQLSIAIALWFLIRRNELPAGLAMSVAILIRPPVVVLGVGLGIIKAIWDRSLRPLATIALPSMVAALGYMIYSRILFGSWSPSAAYEAVGGFWGVDSWLGNSITAFISPRHGVLVWSAWLAVAVFLIVTHRRILPKQLWLIPLLAGVYITIHSALETASGGLPYSYRYPLEAVTFAAPFLFLALAESLRSQIGRVALVAAGGVSLILQSLFAITSRCGFYPSDPEVYVCSLLG